MHRPLSSWLAAGCLATATLGTVLPSMALAGDAASAGSDAELQYGVCVSCHGAHGEGRPELVSPRIGDLDAAYITAQLKAYRDGSRGAHPDAQAMAATVRALDDARIDLLARFITGLDPEHRSAGPAVEGGAAAYAPCVTCHGADGRGVAGTGAPDILFQDTGYVVSQLKQYRDGARTGAMAAFVQGWSDDQIQAVARHVASLRHERPPFEPATGTATEAEGLAAFADIFAVATHPRCMNCHPAGDAPLQGDDSHVHTMGVTRFSPTEGLHCNTCHAAAPVGDGLAPVPPADPIWSLAPAGMVFEGRTPAQVCAQLKDPDLNGGRGPVELTAHVEQDHLLITSWHSGRTPPPISHEALVERFATWANAGAPCPR